MDHPFLLIPYIQSRERREVLVLGANLLRQTMCKPFFYIQTRTSNARSEPFNLIKTHLLALTKNPKHLGVVNPRIK